MTHPAQSPQPQPFYAQPLAPFTRPHRGTTVLVLGILSIVFCCCGGLVLGIIAWVLGSIDIRDMRAGLMDRSGEGPTRAGQVCGIVGVVLSLINAAAWLLWPFLSCHAPWFRFYHHYNF